MASVINVVARPRAHPGRADNDGEVVFYLVEFDANDFTLWEARNAAGVPVDGEALTVGSNIVVTRKTATPVPESPKVALVEVTYSLPTSTGLVIFPQPPAATKWNISIEVEGVSYIEPVNHDRDGKAILNSALYPFDPPPVKEYFDELITVNYTTNAANMAAWDTEMPPARGKINSDVVTLTVKGIARTFAVETLKLGNARYGLTLGLSETGEIEEHYRVSIPLIHRFDTWKRRFLDQGYYELNTAGELAPILDANGQMVSQPVLLDGMGAQLVGDIAVTLDFDIEDTTTFNTFLADIG